MLATIQEMNSCETYDEKHCVEIMKLLNVDRKVKKKFCDGTLRAEVREYPVHKGVVSLVSEFLNKTFTSEMREKYERVVKIGSMTDVVLGKILDFIYTGIIEITLDNVIDLLNGAEFMQVNGLKSNCKDYMIQSICVENCLKFRAYGQRYSLDEVCDASDVVIAESFSDVIQHEDFNELDCDGLSSIINGRQERKDEDVAFTGIVQWVNHNTEQRQQLFVNLFSLMDLSTLSKTFLNDSVLSEPLVFNSLECFQRLLGPSRRLRLTTKRSALNPEDNADKFVVIGGEGSEKTCVTYGFKGKHPLQLPDLTERRCAASVVKIKQRLYLAGGADEPFESSPYQSSKMLNLEDPREWVKIADMLEGRESAASAVSNGRMVVVGGAGKYGCLRSCEIYNGELNQWIGMKPLLQARALHAMVSLDGFLYCVGGHSGSHQLSSAECYDEKIDEWKEIAPMSTARAGLAVVALNGFIYAIGGFNGSDLATTERYCPKANTWTKRGDLNVARNRSGACVMNGKIYVVGGLCVKSTEVYDEAEDRWEICFNMDVCANDSAVVAV